MVIEDDDVARPPSLDGLPERTEATQPSAIQQHERVGGRQSDTTSPRTERRLLRGKVERRRRRVGVEDHHLFAELTEQVIQRDLRADAVAIGVLMATEPEGPSAANQVENGIHRCMCGGSPPMLEDRVRIASG